MDSTFTPLERRPLARAQVQILKQLRLRNRTYNHLVRRRKPERFDEYDVALKSLISLGLVRQLGTYYEITADGLKQC